MKISISGIRGVYGKDLFPKDVFRFCNNFSTLIKSSKCVVARDTRTTGKMILDNVAASLMQNGIDVYNLDIAPTPVVFREAKKYGAGIIVTASHNPVEWNGLKFILEGRGINEDELDLLKTEQKKTNREFGKETIIVSDYVTEAAEIIGNINGNPTITVDLGGGAAKNTAPSLLNKIGCNVKIINDSLENSTRGPDPTSDNLSELIKNSKKLGFAFDLDSDRVVIVSDGKKRSPDMTLGLGVVKSMQLGYKKFVLSVDSSIGIEKYIIENGGSVWRSKVGEANVMQQILANNADAGGEGSSGGFILPEFTMCRDGILTSGLIASMIDDEQFQAAVNIFEKYFQVRTKILLPSELHKKIIEKIKEKLDGRYDFDLLDGIKIKINEYSWALIRESNTEDIIRLSLESNNMNFLKDKESEIKNLINECYEEIK